MFIAPHSCRCTVYSVLHSTLTRNTQYPQVFHVHCRSCFKIESSLLNLVTYMYSAGHGNCSYIYTRVTCVQYGGFTRKKKKNKNKNKNTSVKFYSNNYTKLTLHARCMHLPYCREFSSLLLHATCVLFL